MTKINEKTMAMVQAVMADEKATKAQMVEAAQALEITVKGKATKADICKAIADKLAELAKAEATPKAPVDHSRTAERVKDGTWRRITRSDNIVRIVNGAGLGVAVVIKGKAICRMYMPQETVAKAYAEEKGYTYCTTTSQRCHKYGFRIATEKVDEALTDIFGTEIGEA